GMARSPSEGWFAVEATTTTPPPDLTVEWRGRTYPAAPVASGAAFELFSAEAAEGFSANPRPGAAYPFRGFIHSREIRGDGAPVLDAPDAPLLAPLADGVTLAEIHQLSQSPHGGRAEHSLVSAVRDSARIVYGTKMIKALSPHQAARLLQSPACVSGVCFREHDIAHLRTPVERRVLDGDPHPADESTFALRWRAAGSGDYASPSVGAYPGLVAMPGSDRRGPPVLGTGFVPSSRHLIPEFVTADLADLPLPDRSEILVYTPDGSEIVAFQYLSERAAWTLMAGRQWRHLLAALPGIRPGQEWFPVPDDAHIGLFGYYRGRCYPAVADPPHEFRVRAKSAAARFVVSDVIRTNMTTVWRDTPCAIAGTDDDWVRLRPLHPSEAVISDTGAECVERGVYECWAPGRELGEVSQHEYHYADQPGRHL
ncbi:MAG: hypothetical protein ACRD0P_13140, partial [Stackebrandtia sp.]